MSKSSAISEYMIEHPYTIGFYDTASAAEKVMTAHGVRHLPVVEGKKVVGIISDRDIAVAKFVYKDRSFEGNVLVKDICLFESCTVDEDDPLEKVARKMGKSRLDAVVVVRQDAPVGIFTTTDVCRLLADLFHGPQKRKGFFANLLGW